MTAETTIPVFDVTKLEEYEQLSPKAKDIMKLLDEKIFIIRKYEDDYESFIMTMITSLLEGFEHEEFRTHTVMYKFTDDDTEDVKHMSFRHFIINCILWYPMVVIDPDNLSDDNIVPSSMMNKMTPSFIKSYMDNHYLTVYNRHIPSMPNIKIHEINKFLNNVTGNTNFLLTRISAYFLKFFGISSSIENFRDLAQRIPELNEIYYYKLDESKQPAEMEQDLIETNNRAVELILKDKDFNPIKPLLQPKSGLNLKQFSDMIVNICMKPDHQGRTIAKPINTNYLTGGLQNVTDYYIGAIPGRKAAIINNEFMGKTGHLLIMIAIATSDVKLSRSVMDCNSANPIPIDIKSPAHAHKLIGRRFRRAGDKKYTILTDDMVDNIVDETLYFRSPATCCARDGVCRECYGELYYTNIDTVNTGIFSATYVMNPVVQGILSAKHHQTTNTTLISFSDEFYKFFSISATDIILDVSDDVDIMDYSLVIRRSDIQTTDGEEDDIEYTDESTPTKRRRRKRKTVRRDDNMDEDFSADADSGDGDDELELKLPYFVTHFQVVKNLHSKVAEPEYIDFEDAEKKELFMHTDFIRHMIPDRDENGDYLYIALEDINPEEFIFLVDVYNNELTKPMKSIQKLLNNKAHEGCDTYEELINKMLDLMIASKLDATSVHAEMIIRQLIRKKTNKLKRPDFSRLVMRQDYELLTIGSSLKENPSICTSLATPFLKAQLVMLNDTFKKSSVGVFDDLFKQTLVDED